MNILFLSLLPMLASGLANGGWKSRPISPELEASLDASPTPEKQREPWELGRFLSQSSKFISTPFTQPRQRTIEAGDVVWEPSSSASKIDFTFRPLDDVVMGGVSSSKFDDKTGKWAGFVSESNSGGFVGIRTTPAVEYDMSACKGIRLTLLSGEEMKLQRFKVVIRDSTDFNGVCWTTSFDVGKDSSSNGFLAQLLASKPKPQSVDILFENQVPTIFAKTVPGQVFDPSKIAGMQLAYSKFEYNSDLNPYFELGDMELQVLKIEAI